MLPQDPVILFSVVNTKLRDRYDSLEALCEDMDADQEQLVRTLGAIGYVYHEELKDRKSVV